MMCWFGRTGTCLDKVKRNIVLTVMKCDVLSFEPVRYMHTTLNKDNIYFNDSVLKVQNGAVLYQFNNKGVYFGAMLD